MNQIPDPFALDYEIAEQEALEAVVITDCGNGHRGVAFLSGQLDGIAAEWDELTVDQLEATARRMLDLAAKMRAGVL